MKFIYTLFSIMLLSTSVFAGEAVNITPAVVNINTANQEALADVITGVGEKKAAAIISYREENGPFESVEDLANIKGISAGMIEKNRDRLTVEESDAMEESDTMEKSDAMEKSESP